MLRTEHKRGRLGLIATAVAILVVLALIAWWLWHRAETIVWQTHVVDRGDMLLTATATGNLEPKREVTVGAEISGLVTEVLVSENDRVRQGEVLARFDTDELEVNLEQAEARLAVAQASVAESAATPEEARLASFQTPLLFLLAEDLREMELHIALDEADVALVQAGQPATFTVDAWPNEAFQAHVLKVYLYPGRLTRELGLLSAS